MIDTHRIMLRLVLGSLVLALAQGCIIIDDTDENAPAACPEREDGACFAVSASCPTDAVTLNVFTQPTGATGAFMDPFDCAAGGTVIVDPGTYDLRVEATTAEEDVLFGAPAAMGNEVGDLDDVPLVFEFPAGKGFFWLGWTLEMDGSPVACDDVGAASIEVEATLTSAGTSSTDVLPCLYGGWQTRALDIGEYDITVTLLDGDGGALGSTAEPIAAELAADSELVALPSVTFDIAVAAR
jgi:hypothetical protein